MALLSLKSQFLPKKYLDRPKEACSYGLSKEISSYCNGSILLSYERKTEGFIDRFYISKTDIYLYFFVPEHVYQWDPAALGVYLAAFPVLAMHWLDDAHLLLADDGGPRHRPNFYRLHLEGM